MIEFKTKYTVSYPQHIRLKNINRIVAISTEVCKNIICKGIDNSSYHEMWTIVKEKEGYIFREVTHGMAICGHHKTLRKLVIRSGGHDHIKIVLLDEPLADDLNQNWKAILQKIDKL